MVANSEFRNENFINLKFKIYIFVFLIEKVNLKSIITHHFMFKDTIKAFETVNNEEGIKVMIQVRDG